MLLAFDNFKKSNPAADLKFLVVGAFGWQNSELKNVIDLMQYRDEVIFLGRQPLNHLASLVAGAYALIYMSLFEGFGVPPLEGMKCAVPVITSHVSSMPEICGDAALLADPRDIHAISGAIARLWSDKALYENLVKKGLAQAQKYSWDICAGLLWESCLRTIKSKI
jgi:glycosyltransferase involved in cell wall biosynthesis